MARYKINDSIHKIISFSEREKAIIDHPYFQRLRHIRQLSFVSLVFPNATHDRFTHSLGAMHVASLLSEQLLYDEVYSVLAHILSENEKDSLALMMRLSGLLHDIGHPPFSHAAEEHMPPIKSLGLPEKWFKKESLLRPVSHEDYSVLTIRALSKGKEAVLSSDEAHIISSLVHKDIIIPESWKNLFRTRVNAESLHGLARSWISGDIDIDRMDYLLRDSYFTGVSYGNYDISWLVKNLGVIEKNGGYVTSISDAGVHAFEYYLLARYNMFTQVYFHKTVRCFEYYFKKALSGREVAYRIPAKLSEYMMLRDSTLTESLFEYGEKHVRSWSRKLVRREPAKRVLRMWQGQGKDIEKLFRALKKDLNAKQVHPFMVFSRSKFLDYEGGLQDRKSSSSLLSLFSPLSMTPIMVVRKQFGMRTAINLEDYSFILKQYHQDINIGDVFILHDEYERQKTAIKYILKKHFMPFPSEIVLDEE